MHMLLAFQNHQSLHVKALAAPTLYAKASPTSRSFGSQRHNTWSFCQLFLGELKAFSQHEDHSSVTLTRYSTIARSLATGEWTCLNSESNQVRHTILCSSLEHLPLHPSQSWVSLPSSVLTTCFRYCTEPDSRMYHFSLTRIPVYMFQFFLQICHIFNKRSTWCNNSTSN